MLSSNNSCKSTRAFLYCSLLLIYCLLLVFGTWFPLSNWDWSAGGVSQFLAMDIFEHMSLLDACINLVIYMPFGFLAAQLLAGTVLSRTVITTLLGVLLSTGLEMGQTFLPGRFTSLSDIILNTLGTMLGALIAIGFHTRHLFYNKYRRKHPGVLQPIGKAAKTPRRDDT
jgi:glycopeptide antibiotics resistance protein